MVDMALDVRHALRLDLTAFGEDLEVPAKTEVPRVKVAAKAEDDGDATTSGAGLTGIDGGASNFDPLLKEDEEATATDIEHAATDDSEITVQKLASPVRPGNATLSHRPPLDTREHPTITSLTREKSEPVTTNKSKKEMVAEIATESPAIALLAPMGKKKGKRPRFKAKQKILKKAKKK